MNSAKKKNTRMETRKGKHKAFRNVQEETEGLTPRRQVIKILLKKKTIRRRINTKD